MKNIKIDESGLTIAKLDASFPEELIDKIADRVMAKLSRALIDAFDWSHKPKEA